VEFFPEPVAYTFEEDLVKVPGLDGSTKMSKSENENSVIFLADPPEVIRKKVMRAVTDEGPVKMNQPKSQPIENIFNLMRIVSLPETFQHFEEKYNTCKIRYGDMKKQLAEDITRFTEPFRERIKKLSSDDAYLKKVTALGAEKARASASKTIREVREIIGFKSF
jgi:tryptophanyl-tRNA synthetase